MIDTEHAPFSFETVRALVDACRLAGVAAIVRVAENSPVLIGRALDTGADGVMIPSVSTAREAQKAVRAAKYAPEGDRGLVDMLRYRSRQPEMYAAMNASTIVAVQIEGAAAVSRAAEILGVPGVDVGFVGALDLSQSAGAPGNLDAPRFSTLIRSLVAVGERSGARLGIYAPSVEIAQRFRAGGFTMIAHSTEALLLYEMCRLVREQLVDTAG